MDQKRPTTKQCLLGKPRGFLPPPYTGDQSHNHTCRFFELDQTPFTDSQPRAQEPRPTLEATGNASARFGKGPFNNLNSSSEQVAFNASRPNATCRASADLKLAPERAKDDQVIYRNEMPSFPGAGIPTNTNTRHCQRIPMDSNAARMESTPNRIEVGGHSGAKAMAQIRF